MTRLILVLTLTLTVLAAACAGTDDVGIGGPADEATPAETPTDETPTDPDPTPEELEDAVELPDPIIGVLDRVEVEGGCAVIEIDGERYHLVAAPGASIVVDGGNGVVATTDGEVIAEQGDTIEVTGAIDPGMMTFCQIGTVLVADDVSLVEN